MRWARYIPFFILPLLVVVLMPHAAFAATSMLNPITSVGECACPGSAPDWGCVLQTFQVLMNDFVVFATLLIVLYFGFAGFTFIQSPLSDEKRTQARNRMLNAVIGLMIVLCAWLIVDSVMKVLYNPAATGPDGVQFGPWNSILGSNGNDFCIIAKEPAALPGINGASNAAGLGTPDAPGGVANNGPLRTGGVNACNAATIQSAAAAEGVTISNNTANTEACLAKFESSCGAVNLNYKWNQGSSAAGAFQVTLSGNSKCYDNAACEAAVGASGPLNCASGFRNGNPIPGSQTANTCVRAAANLGCSAAAAQCVLNTQGISAYTADKHSSGQAFCGG